MIWSERISERLPVSREALFRVLTDYERYQEWVPGVTRSRVIVREGDIFVAEFEVPRLSPRPVTFELVQEAPARVVYSQVGQLRERGLAGVWTMAELEGDREALLEGRADLKTPFYRVSARARLRETVREALRALRVRAQSLGTEAQGPPSGERRKILEVRRRQKALEVWYRGQIYSSRTTPDRTP